AASNGWKLREQAQTYGVSKLALFNEEAAKEFDVPAGIQSMCDLAKDAEVDIVVISVAGVIGLIPTMDAIRAGKQIALASKEVLVAAGEIVMPALREHGVTMTPIDSEHSAIFQCLQGSRSDQIGQLILTASGGPFRGRKRADLGNITVEQALNHPTWRMGGKITIDSATLMNKGLETIEAKWLFDVPIENVDVVVHPQSVIHSIVKFLDGSALGQMGWPDMRLPIQYALLYPERVDSLLPPWNPVDTPSLTFEPVDHETFPALQLAKEAARIGGTMPCVMNAANEAMVARFLAGEIGFLEITERVEQKMAVHDSQPASFEALVEADRWAREA
ncbi:MAG: 1-deoxy-D-xylulose-5-phosphate reductoisomerase, partial [Fimbriimonadaceae bacterium]